MENRYGIPEPPADVPRSNPGELDIIFLPLVAWDRRGSRLGMGGGIYDRTLEGVRGPLLVGLAHSLQELDHIPAEPWDIRLHFIASDKALHRCHAEGDNN